MGAFSASLLAVAALGATPVHAAETCAKTTDRDTPTAPRLGEPCWVDVTPYPFGSNGEPVDVSKFGCPHVPPDTSINGYDWRCYLRLQSLTFRAWNRGLAATSSDAFAVWRYNGNRWYPDPTFPGRSACKGDTVLWAGKLDYWLVGGDGRYGSTASSLCRYDGANFAWQPLTLPQETVARTVFPAGNQFSGVRAGSCFAWDDCWFFGAYGVRLHWDGETLTDATADFTLPWLRTNVRAAIARGSTGVAVTSTGNPDAGDGERAGEQVPANPDGSAPPQLYRSSGGTFDPFAFTPPTVATPDDPWRTDLVAVDVDAAGRGWVAGRPVGYTGLITTNEPARRRTNTPQPAPIVPFALGAQPACTAPSPGFEVDSTPGPPNGREAYMWNSLSVFPQSGDALAGGLHRPSERGASENDDGRGEPVLTHVSCDGTIANTRFREPDPTTPNGVGIVPANRGSGVPAVAANAANDAWATTTGGSIALPSHGPEPELYTQRPRLYRWTDGERPAALAGDDEEERPLLVEEYPPIIIEDAPPPEPPPAPDSPPQVVQPPPAKPRPPQKAAVYGARISKKIRRVRGNTFAMVVHFRVRRPVTVGVQALRRNKVVGRSGLKRFKGKRGTLTIKINRKRWPTRIRFYTRNGSIG